MSRNTAYIDPYMEIEMASGDNPDHPPIHSSHKSDESQKAQLILCVGSIFLFFLVGCILNCIRSRHQHYRKLIRSWSQFDKKNNYLNIDDSVPEVADEVGTPITIA